ncbi:MAG: carbohydrate ABC transporter permease [Ruminococcaceae bacterium]|nr:carbohydrate ABC transporter permease [Oscillospiraceae bacterium]
MKHSNIFVKGSVHLVLIILSLLCLLPFIMILSVSLTSEAGIQANGYGLIPSEWSLEAYRYIFRNPTEVISAYTTTIFVTVVGTISGTLIMAMMAYPMSRRDFQLKNALSFFVYFTMLFSGGLVPVYILVTRYLNLKDNVLALILPILIGGWNVMLLRMFISSIPMSLIEAANLEGASEFRIFFSIVFPLAKVGIVTVALFQVLGFWNDWYQAMLYIDHGNMTTLQYMLYRVMNKVNLAKEYGGMMAEQEKLPNENLRMALCVVAAGPMLCVFPFFQKYFSKGIVVGGVKG